MRQMLALLEDELKVNVRKTVLSKEMLLAVIASATQAPALLFSNVDPLWAGVAGIGALGKLWSDYCSSRNQTLRSSPVGYLYKSKQFPYY
jgi:hypothetical protein